MPALLALIAVTAVWGFTFVQVKDALELYPLFAFLAVRFAIASVVLAAPAARRMRTLGRPGWVAGAALGLLLALGYGLQTAGLERTTVSSAGFITGLYVVFTPLLALAALPDARRPARSGSASRLRSSGSRCSPESAPAIRSATCSSSSARRPTPCRSC